MCACVRVCVCVVMIIVFSSVPSPYIPVVLICRCLIWRTKGVHDFVLKRSGIQSVTLKSIVIYRIPYNKPAKQYIFISIIHRRDARCQCRM